MSANWFNGELVATTLSLDVGDRGFLLGDGVFETVAVNHGKAIWLTEHLARLSKAASELGIVVDFSKISSGIEQVLGQHANVTEVLRISVSRGATSRGLAAEGLSPSILISLNVFDLMAQPQTFRLATSTIRRNETAPSSRLKTLSYIDAIAAAREVKDHADDALMLSSAGFVASTSVGNIFLMRGSELVTPGLDQGILPGITRAKILELEDWNMRETSIHPSDMHEADAVFVTNSLRLLTPVISLDGKTLGQRPLDGLKRKLNTLTGRI